MLNNLPTRWHIDESVYEAYTIDCLTMVNTHWHSHFLLNLFTEGDGIQEINGKCYPIHKGSIIIISPLDFHRNIIKKDKNVSVCAVKFSNKFFHDSLDAFCDLENFPIVTTLSDEDFETAKALFSLLIKEQEKKSLGSDKFAANLIEQLVILAIRASGFVKQSSKSSGVRKALSYIHYNFRHNIKASDVATYIGYSPNYFSSAFKKETGVEFQKYLQGLRLDFAMNLLKLSDLSVTEACFESGFNTLPHFSQAFKKKFGASPEKFKEEQK